MIDFPELIKSTREGLGETQAEFAERFGSHANTVSRWESGQYQAPYAVISFVLGEQEPDLQTIYSCWGTEAGFRLTVNQGSHGRVCFLAVDEVNRNSFQVCIEKHHAANLVKAMQTVKARRSGGDGK